LVLLALPDDDDAVHGDRVEHEPHRVDGGLVCRRLVPAAHPPGRGERRRLGHANDLEREVPVRPVVKVTGHRSTSRMQLGSAASNTTRRMAEWYGRSSPCSWARRATARADSTPSTAIPRPSM